MSLTNYFTELKNDLLKYANENPRDFIFLVLLILTPFFLLSAFMSWKLSKHIQEQQKKEKKVASKAKQTRDVKAKGSRTKRE